VTCERVQGFVNQAVQCHPPVFTQHLVDVLLGTLPVCPGQLPLLPAGVGDGDRAAADVACWLRLAGGCPGVAAALPAAAQELAIGWQ